MSSVAYLGLGGNLGDPVAAIASALQLLDQRADIEVEAVSRLYRTPPWGRTDQPDFHNAAAAIRTTLDPEALLDACLSAERELKRVRAERWGPRTIDIDILALAGTEHRSERLTVPHRRLTERAFALLPLADLAPDLELAGRSVADWCERVDRQAIEMLGEGRDWWRPR